MPKTEQIAYPYQQHLHKAEAAVNTFYGRELSLEEQLLEAEKLLVAANRLHTAVTDALTKKKSSVA